MLTCCRLHFAINGQKCCGVITVYKFSKSVCKLKNNYYFPTVSWELSSLDFTVNRFFMKLFRTGNIEVVLLRTVRHVLSLVHRVFYGLNV